MGVVSTNTVSISYASEQTPGNLPGSPTWKLLEINEINSLGATTSTVVRDFISRNRQARKGTITDLDSAADLGVDLTIDSFKDFAEGFMFSTFVGAEIFAPTATTAGGSGGYTVPSGTVLAANTLVAARGFTQDANNGFKVVQSGSTATNIRVNGLVAETTTTTQNARVEVAGIRATSGDLQINAQGNLTSTTLDFTTLGLTVGQAIFIGGENTANQFAEAANKGFVRIRAIAANLLTLDKRAQTYVTDNGSGKQIDLLFGRFTRTVATDHANYLARTFTFENALPNLNNPSGDAYEYSRGNYCSELAVNIPLTDKATISAAFVGFDTAPPTTTRETNAANPLVPVETTAFNTSADVMRLRMRDVDDNGITTDFKSLSITLNNNVSPEKVIGTLGARFMNVGNIDVTGEAQLLFTDAAVASAVRNNTTVSLDFGIQNDDGGIFIDIPALTLGGGDKEYPQDESVLINTTITAFQDPSLGTSASFSTFAYLPTLPENSVL